MTAHAREKQMEKRISEAEAVKRIQDGLQCSEAEAREIREYDKKIDRGESTPFDLDPTAAKIAQKFAHTGTRKKTVYNFNKRERKANPTKGGIVAELAEFLQTASGYEVHDLQIVNAERQITFQIGAETFDLTLVQKRKKKE